MRFSNEPHQPQDYLRTLVIMVLLVISQILAPL
jgi:hypothetical protein